MLVSIIAYTFQDPSRAVDFLSKILESRERLGPEASLCIESDIIVMKLRLGLVDECRTLIDEAKDKLQQANTSEAVVFSKYYKAVSEFRKVLSSSPLYPPSLNSFPLLSLLVHQRNFIKFL